MQNKYVSIETGEILSKREITKKNKKHLVEIYVGMETRFPCECVTKDQLLECLKSLDNYIDNPTVVNTSALLKMVTDNTMTVKESAIMSYLSEGVTGWNYYIGRVCDLEHIVGDSKNLNRMIKGLESKGLIKVTHKGFFYKDSVVIRISPFYVWKGNHRLRHMELQYWYGKVEGAN